MNGKVSQWGNIEAGVPQGSVLGPLLFLVYINDLENGIKSKIKFFADDTSLFSIVTDPFSSAIDLNHDLKLIEKWAFQWKMSFNPDLNKQATELLFSNKKGANPHPPVFFNDSIVNKVAEHTHLGLTLDPKLSFVKHITGKIQIARKGIGVIRYLSPYVSVGTLDQLYKLFVRPHFDYADVIYHIPQIDNSFSTCINLNNLMNSIEQIQYQAARAVSGTWKGTNTSKLYEELGWESMTDRRWFHRLLHFFKISNGLTPNYLSELLPPPRPMLYGSRRENVLSILPSNTTRYEQSFFPNSTRIWNEIGVELRSKTLLANSKALF